MAFYKTTKTFNVLHICKGFQNKPKNVYNICAFKKIWAIGFKENVAK